jgi:hypothetical protein
MGIKIFLFFFGLIITMGATAQQMVVYHTKGNVAVRVGNKKTPATKGTVIGKNAYLEVKNGSTCMLIGQKGHSVQIDKEGTYSHARLEQLIAAGKNQGVSSKFFAYVYDNLLYKKEKIAVNVTPVVYRAEPLMKMPEQYSFSTAAEIIFTWRQTALKSTVHFQLLTHNDSVLIDTIFKSNQTSFRLTPQILELLPGQLYKWNAEDQYNTAKVKVHYFFMVVNEEKKKSYESAWKAINNSTYSNELKLSLKRDLLLQEYEKQ